MLSCRHLEITAFLASLCKVCGVLERGVIPPNVNYAIPNPAIRWQQYRLRVPREAEPLQARNLSGRPLIAMTSSGIGGANGHAVVEGAPPPLQPPLFWNSDAITNVPALLVAGGLSPRTVTAIGEATASRLGDSSNDDKAAHKLARTLGRQARSMTWRSYALAGKGSKVTFSKPSLAPRARPPIVFVFSGQGPQHFHSMSRARLSCFPCK